MPHWVGWSLVAVAAAIAEIFTEGFFIIWFGVGAVVAIVAALAGSSLEWQFVVFVLSSLILVLSTKKLTARWHKKDGEPKTAVYALEGKDAVVTADIPARGSGQIKVGGEIWAAKTETGTAVPKGATVKIIKVEGVHAVVRPPE